MRKINKKIWLKGAIVVAVILVFFASAPYVLRHSLVKVVQESCKECTLKIPSSDFNPLTGSFDLEEVDFQYIKAGSLELSAKIENIEGDISYIDLLRGRVSLATVILKNPKVELVDIEQAPKDSAQKEQSEKGEEKTPEAETLNFDLSYVAVEQGSFSYINKDKGVVSRLNMGPINGRMEGLGNSDEFKENTVYCRLVGRIEKSGEIVLTVNSKVFERPLKVAVDVQAKGQRLSDLNSFFNPFAGLNLVGDLIEGTSQVRLVERNIKASVFARFEKFNVKFSKTRERSSVVTFFMNLAETVVYDNQNLDKNRPAQLKHVEINRKQDESIVGFILRGMKEAALKVAEK